MTVYPAPMDGFVFWMTAAVAAMCGVVIAALSTAAATRAGRASRG